MRNTWKGIKNIINLDISGKTLPSCLQIGETLVTNPTEIAHEFNSYFSSVGKNLQSKIYSKGNHFSKYLDEKSNESFFISPTDKHEILEIINSNLGKKATWPYSIPSDILDIIKFIIAEPLSNIINLSFTTGIYIDKLKISKIIPIFKKKGSNLLCENFRPISLLSNINKIFEKIMHKRLYDFLETQGTIYILQFGFRNEF